MLNVDEITENEENEIRAITIEISRNLDTLMKILESEEIKVGLVRISIRADSREKYSSKQQIICGNRMRLNKQTVITMPLHHIDFNESYTFNDFKSDLGEIESKSTNPNFQETIYIKSLWLKDEITEKIATFNMVNATLPEQKLRLKETGNKLKSNLILDGIFDESKSTKGKIKLGKEYLRVPKTPKEYEAYRNNIRGNNENGTVGYSHLTISAYEIYIPNISKLTDHQKEPLIFRDCSYVRPFTQYKVPNRCEYYSREDLIARQKTT